MSTAVLERAAQTRPTGGGVPARRAIIRWAWRLFRREWRQQFLILALIIFAVAATIIGSTVAIDAQQPSTFGFGTAGDSATFLGTSAHEQSEVTYLQHRFGRVDVIENETLSIPGSINTFQLRSQDPSGPYGAPMLRLLSGHYPQSADQVAVTHSVASAFHLKLGGTWNVGGRKREVVGTVENPLSLLDDFALVTPGQVRTPGQVVVLFDAPGVKLSSFKLGTRVETPTSVAQSNPINPQTISLAALAIGMLLIALVSVGGFTVLAQRRLRSIGMLQSVGASDRHVRLVVRANGTVVGIVGAIGGFLLGVVVWLLYRPNLEQSSHHLIAMFALPWKVVAASMLLAVAAAYFAASRPARAIARVPIVAALSGRPAPPRQVRRSAIPGIVLLVAAFLLFSYSGAASSATVNSGQGGGNSGISEMLLGIVMLVPGLILLAPFFLSFTARLARHVPLAPRLALRDLARYRARSGSALAAISIGVLVAVIVILAAAARYGNVLDYAGPNLASNELALHSNTPPPAGTVLQGPNGPVVAPKPAVAPETGPELEAAAASIARGLGAKLIGLESPNAQLISTVDPSGRQWDGAIYVATPQLLRAFGISESDINPDADVLTSRPGLSGVSGLGFSYGSTGKMGSPSTCTNPSGCVIKPVVQEIGALPAGVSAPNTVITEHAMSEFHIQWGEGDWLVQGSQAFSASQISDAELTASVKQLSVESKDDQPTSLAVLTWATLFGIVIALGVLGMSVGLVRSETTGDLRTLAANGASSFTLRMISASTAAALGFLGALIGMFGGYLALIGWLRGNSLNGGVSALWNVPVENLLFILIGMPMFAGIVAWLLSGRQPAAMSHQPIE